jgi:hypothetical protein
MKSDRKEKPPIDKIVDGKSKNVNPNRLRWIPRLQCQGKKELSYCHSLLSNCKDAI